MTRIQARPMGKWDIFWWLAAAAFLALGLAGCGAAHPEPTGDGMVEDVQTDPGNTTEGEPGNPGTTTDAATDATTGTTGDATADTTAGNAATPSASSANVEGAKTALDAELAAFGYDPEEVDTPSIDQLDDRNLITPAVVSAWTSGYNYSVGEATETGTGLATVKATITCRKIGAAVNQGQMTADQLAEQVSRLEPETTEVTVEMRLDDDREWEVTPAGDQALDSALVGTLAR